MGLFWAPTRPSVAVRSGYESWVLKVTPMVERTELRSRLYESYASGHAGCGTGAATALIFRRDIAPALPAHETGPVVDIGCRQGGLVRLMIADGYDADGIDVSPEQVAIAHKAGLEGVRRGGYYELLRERPIQLTAITAIDLLEHLTSNEVLATFDIVASALMPGGVFVGRVPNAVSPLGGHIRYGDFTHESWFTTRSIRQIAAATGFEAVTVMPCPPPVHGVISAARWALWKLISGLYKIALAAETGTLRGHIVTQNMTFTARKAS